MQRPEEGTRFPELELQVDMSHFIWVLGTRIESVLLTIRHFKKKYIYVNLTLILKVIESALILFSFYKLIN